LKRQTLALALILMPVALAQNVGTFTGPSVLTQGANTIGRRSGQDIDLRLYGSVDGIYDNGLIPLATRDGALVRPEGLYGVEAGLGAYGRHTFRRSVFGVDYSGNYRHYVNGSSFDGSNHNLRLGYTLQKSRKLIFDFTGFGGTQNFGALLAGTDAAIVDSASMLFDNRTSFLQGGMNTTYLLSNRTAVTVGGSAYTVRRQARQLVGVNGYTLTGSLRHQVNRNLTVGASYQRMHYDFPRAFGESDLNAYTGVLSRNFGRGWRIDVSGGIFSSEVQGVQTTALDPAIAALLGIGSVQTIFYRTNILPMGSVTLTKSYRRASFNASYDRSVNPGNGLFLTSRQENYGAGFSYTGIRRWTFTVSGNSMTFNALGQQLQQFRQISGTTRASYRLGGGLNVTAGYTHRRQDINSTLFLQNASRVSLGIAFQPGDIPISFH
jgi:hypothetical protein